MSRSKGVTEMKGQTYTILAIVLVIIIAVFAVINVAPVEVNYIFTKVDSPLILVILFSVLMGGLITGAVGMLKIYKLQRNIKSLESQNSEMQALLKQKGLLSKVNLDKEKPSRKEKR